MATFTVGTALDGPDPNGRLSLREAVAQANAAPGADTIVFAAALEGQTLVLTGGELAVTDDLRIDGDSNNDGARVTLSGGDATRLVSVTGGSTDVVLRDIALTDGLTRGAGGAIQLGGGSLTLRGSSVTDSNAPSGGGGAIFAADGTRLNVIDSSIVDNHAIVSGGGIGAGAIDLVVRDSVLTRNGSLEGGGGAISSSGRLVIEDSMLSRNGAYTGGAISLFSRTATIARTAILDNGAGDGAGGGIAAGNARVLLTESTVANNRAPTESEALPHAEGGGIWSAGGALVVRNSTVSGNYAGSETYGSGSSGGGIWASGALDVANSIVAGNRVLGPNPSGFDIAGGLTLSAGHNVFGSDVLGDIAGDREDVAASALFASIDPATGGGLVGPAGIVALRANVANPAISGGDPLAANTTGQGSFNVRPYVRSW